MSGTLPRFARISQGVTGPVVDDVAAAVTRGLDALRLDRRVRAGDTVAVTAGSRGITDIVAVLRTVVAHLRELGAAPFLVPAMGSHGGGTAAGQRRLLESYGMTERAVGCPIVADVDAVEIGRSARGIPLWQGRVAAEANHVVVCNRVKPHTQFAGRVESGLAKMLMIGLGKCEGAAICHRAVMQHGWEAVVDDLLPAFLGHTKVLCGVALVERSDERTAKIAVLPADRWPEDEPGLLDDARHWMPRLPFTDIDLLLLDRIGKNISGTGLDTNVVGRKDRLHPGPFQPHGPVKFIAVRGLTPETYGNAIGVGLAEFARSRVLRAMDVSATRLNALTAGDLPAAMLPVDYESDREIIDVALTLIGLRTPAQARIVWARNTLELGETLCSMALVDEARRRDDLAVQGEPGVLVFDDGGNLPDDLPV